ncbi:hypothetical protein LCGC14_0463980 [marine sediment metagenome]|uniref:Uncharacterized protein n=1 Tax=marine sediment metagenome TaxID=412755 RepID=A0A0F9SEC2_9ZZZZ
MSVLNFFHRRNGSLRTEHPTDYLFTLDGLKHYRYKDISKTNCQRMFAANDYFNELSMRCSREYLQEHTKAMDVILSDKSIDIQKVSQLNLQLKERLDMIHESDMIYKIASVIIFDTTENPHDYDFKYGQEKIQRFKKKAQSDPMFLIKLFKITVGSPNLSDKDLLTYMEVGSKINQEHLATISTILSNNIGTTDYSKMSGSQSPTE